ncbi:MAG: sigma-70 family RNA polymerase sigma factor [Clostridia bacterium]|nr:sigma-70 family RNA polymerase sigma factor [Clostridia bacterium]
MDEIFEIIKLAQKNDEQAFRLLLEKYNALIISMSQKYSSMCYGSVRDDDDFIQETKLAFYNAVKTYSKDKNVTFGAYAKICIRNKLISYIRALKSKKRSQSIELDDSYSNSPQDYLLEHELEKKLFYLARNCLSDYEKEIFTYYLNGSRAKEISVKIGKSEKSVNNAIYRIKAKLKKTLNNDT